MSELDNELNYTVDLLYLWSSELSEIANDVQADNPLRTRPINALRLKRVAREINEQLLNTNDLKTLPKSRGSNES